MHYKILYCKWVGGQRRLAIFNFKTAEIVEFTLDEMNEIDDENLRRYIHSIWDSIQAGHWDYTI